MFFSTLVYSQEILVLGCEGEITQVTSKLHSTKPKENTKETRKIVTDIQIDKKNKIMKVQNQELDICGWGGEDKCVCNFDENNYECKLEQKLNTENTDSENNARLLIGRKTGTTHFQNLYYSTYKMDSGYQTFIYQTSGQLNCEIKKTNKF